ncbi:MAG: Na+/H+ antiporter NhaA [Chloroflexi bacterium]|nr:Na+/H+ antiporter NhaA [Chloroflexota bacterium]
MPAERRPALAPLVRPLQEFLTTETAGGALLLAATAVALLWANAPFSGTYGDFWGARISMDLNVVTLDETLVSWVNDGLMAVFFFVVGLEIKREVLKGELSEPRNAALPVVAALGGMVAPALIFLAFNLGRDGERGWGIPMATDIAFAMGVLSLVGSRVPLSLRVFLLALAIVDDLGAIAVIAVFYTEDLSPGWLAAALGLFLLTYALGRLGVRHLVVYAGIAAVAWVAVKESGVHATIAGVALALLTPAAPYVEREEVERSAVELVGDVRAGGRNGGDGSPAASREALHDLEEVSREGQSVLDRLEHALHPWASYAIVPIFALANAGIAIDGEVARAAVTSPTAWGVAAGLMLGKPLGITLFAFAAVRMGWAALPAGVRWGQLAGVAMIAGIGFTVSLFVTGLAFKDGALVDDAKLGILAGSALIGIAGLVVLRLMPAAEDA